MSLYDLPSFPQIPFRVRRIRTPRFLRQTTPLFLVSVFAAAMLAGFLGGFAAVFLQARDGRFLANPINILSDFQGAVSQEQYIPQTTQEEKIIRSVQNVSPAVVSIIITEDIAILEQYFVNPFGENSPFEFQVPQYRQRGTEKREVGGGSGFIVSADGLVVTNKHVVINESAEYTVLTNDGNSYPAEVLARDPVQDLAILKIAKTDKAFSVVTLGDSDVLQIGQTVVAIGNALGEFRNTVSVGVISGLGRTITASGGDFVETIEDVIQTDAAINRGNSGGPILNLAGQVVGMNTATVSGAQNIGFAIPINKVRRAIQQVQAGGEITYAFLGVRYIQVTASLQREENLAVDYGALVVQGQNGQAAVEQGSPAAAAGIARGDIILEIDEKKITPENSLGSVIQKHNPGDRVLLKVLSGAEEKTLTAQLGSRTQ